MKSIGRFKALNPIELDDVVTLGYILSTVTFDTCDQIRENIFVAAKTYSLEYILYDCLDSLDDIETLENGDYISNKILFTNVSIDNPGIIITKTKTLDVKAIRFYLTTYTLGQTPKLEISFDDGLTWNLLPEEGIHEMDSPFQAVKFKFTFVEKSTFLGFAFAHDKYIE